MWAYLARFTEWLMKGSVKTALAGAGLGLASAGMSLTLVQQYLEKVQQYGNSMAADALALLSLSGADVALSMIIGAIMAKFAMNGAKVALVRKQ